MKILLTNDELHEVRGGSQIFIADLAGLLRERGHELAVYAWLRGSLADEVRRQGVPVLGSPVECGFEPDVIHAQHHLAAMTALTAFPRTPAVYHCHGYSPWQERPPAHPRIVHYAAAADAMAPWMAEITGRPRREIIVLPGSVHLRRFAKVRSLGLQPRHAVLFGNAFTPPEHISKLRKACTRCGVTLDLVGAQFENTASSPEDLLPGYDIAFAIGRSAMEAMASGCAVILFSAQGCGPIMEPRRLDALLKLNLTVPESVPALTVRQVIGQLEKFDAGGAAAVTAEVRARFSFELTCDRLETLYQETVTAWRERPRPPADDEFRALSAYLTGLGPYIKGADDRFEAIRTSREKSKKRAGRLKLKSAALDRKLKLLERRLPGALWRWLLRE